jgi:protein-disulfide isomerase
MKKLILASVFTFVGLTAFAQNTETAMATTATDVVTATQDSFSAIETSELPEAVSTAVSTNYPSATIDKAYVNDQKQYKIEVSLEDGTSGTLYADENGNWIDM